MRISLSPQCCLNCQKSSYITPTTKRPPLISMQSRHDSLTHRLSHTIASSSEDDRHRLEPASDIKESASASSSPSVSLALVSLQFYKSFISPLMPSVCRYQPSCSSYSVDAYTKYGLWRGTVLTAWRLLRCNPWSGSGYDPAHWPPVGLQAIYSQESELGAQATVAALILILYIIIQDLVYELGSL